MKNVVVLVIAVVFGFGAMAAENTNSVLKQEIAKGIEYPKFAKDNLLEGTVWLQVSVNEESKIEVVYWSATNVELGQYVKKQLKDITVSNASIEKGKMHNMKFKFELNKAE